MDHYLSSTNPDMSVPSVNQESSSSQAEVKEPSEDCLLQNESALPMVELPDTTGVSVSQLQHPTNNTDNTQIKTMLEYDIGTEKNTITSKTPDKLELMSSNICTEERSANKTAPYDIAGPSTFEPTIDHSVSHHSLQTTKTHVIYSRIPVSVGTSKRKEYEIGHSSTGQNVDQEVFSEQNCGDTGRIKRPRLDVTDTSDLSDKISLIESMKMLLGPAPVVSVNNNNSLTQASLLPLQSNSEDNDKVIAKNDTHSQHEAVNLTLITKPSVNEETGDRFGSDAIHNAPSYIKEQTSDHQEQCKVVADLKPKTCETGSSEMSENPITESFQSETLSVSGTIISLGGSIPTNISKWNCSKASKEAQNVPHMLIKAEGSAYKKIVEEQEPRFSRSRSDLPWSAIKKEFDTLANYMDPIPVIDLWTTHEEPSRASLIRDFQNASNTTQISRKLLEFVQTNGFSAYSKFKKFLVETEQQALAQLLKLAEKNKDTSSLKWMLEHKHHQKPSDGSLFEDFKEDLITYYRDNDAYISISPLVEQHDVPLNDFYVRPPMRGFVKPHILSKSTDQRERGKTNDETYLNKNNDGVHQNKEIASYKELFFKEDGSPFTKIYLTAPAGMGKSSLSQHITMCWCQSHKPVGQSLEKYKTNDIKAMKEFDLLFLLHLREYEGNDQCKLDDMIIRMCSNLSRPSRYTREVLETVLHERRCLIILDGLDEWTHPGTCPRKPCVPHNNHPKNCTVLTTTRDWKLATVGMSAAHIERHVEICELDDKRSAQLKTNAITTLIKRGPGAAQMNQNDFDKKVSAIPDDDIFNTPYIKLLLITLLYDGIPISKSRCELYSNIIELTLTRGLQKSDLPFIQTSQPDDESVLPMCMKKNTLCKLYINLISKIGQIAFSSLFDEKREFRLLFHKDMVLQHLTESELEFCLKTGLLCQAKDSSMLTKICHRIFFQHKSIQEYFAGFYISMQRRNDSTPATILKVCQSLPEILEMSNVFIFVCGMNPYVFKNHFYELQKVVELDPITSSYRSVCTSDNRTQWEIEENLKSYQKFQVACFKENLNNGNDECQIPIRDLILTGRNKDASDVKTMISSNPEILKSLNIQYFNMNDSRTLVQKDVLNVFLNSSDLILSLILNESVNSLTCISLHGIAVTCKVLCSLFNHIADMQMLRTIHMNNVKCSECLTFDERICGMNSSASLCFKLYYHSILHKICQKETHRGKLDLSKTSKLKHLHLAYIPVSQLVISKTSQLQQIHLENILLSELDLSMISQLQQLHLAYLSLMGLDLSRTKHIKKLHLEYIPISELDLSQNIQLQQLHLKNIPLSKLDLSLTNQLQQLHLENIPLSQLDLFQTSKLQHLHLTNELPGELEPSPTNSWLYSPTKSTPYNEFLVNSECLIKCITSSLTYTLPHNSLCRLSESIRDAKDIQIVVLKNINCSDHNEMCIGNSLILSQHTQLENMELHNISLTELVISQTNQLKVLDLQNIPTTVLDISPDSQLTMLKFVNIPLSVQDFSSKRTQKNLNFSEFKLKAGCLTQLFITDCVLTHSSIKVMVYFIQKANNLTNLSLTNVNCSDHYDVCIGIPLTLCQLNELSQLHLQGIRLMDLRLPQSCSVRVKLVQITMPALAFKTMLLSAGKEISYFEITLKQERISASILREVILSTGIVPQHVTVKLCGIEISGSEWKDVFRTFSGWTKPVTLKLTNIKMSDSAWTDVLRPIYSLNQPVILKLTNITMSDSSWTDVFRTISSTAPSVSLKLANILMSDSAWTDVIHAISSSTQSVSLALANIQMSDSAWTDVIRTFSSFTKPLALKLTNITMSETAWKELFLSIGNLSQPLKLSKISMSVTAWQELLIDTAARLPKSVTVELDKCMGPSIEEWSNIQTMLASTSVYSELGYRLH